MTGPEAEALLVEKMAQAMTNASGAGPEWAELHYQTRGTFIAFARAALGVVVNEKMPCEQCLGWSVPSNPLHNQSAVCSACGGSGSSPLACVDVMRGYSIEGRYPFHPRGEATRVVGPWVPAAPTEPPESEAS